MTLTNEEKELLLTALKSKESAFLGKGTGLGFSNNPMFALFDPFGYWRQTLVAQNFDEANKFGDLFNKIKAASSVTLN